MEPWKERLYAVYLGASPPAPASVPGDGRRPFHERIVRRSGVVDRAAPLLDLGCGGGALLATLRDLGFRDLSGVDTSAQQVAVARHRGFAEVVHGRIADFLARTPRRYAAVFMIDVLEHLATQELLDTLDAVHRVLAPGGCLVAQVPNAEGLFGMGIRYGDLTHETCFTRASLQQALDACGYAAPRFHEESPAVHGLVSLGRRVVWEALAAPVRLLLLAETGARGHLLSRNLTVVAPRGA